MYNFASHSSDACNAVNSFKQNYNKNETEIHMHNPFPQFRWKSFLGFGLNYWAIAQRFLFERLHFMHFT